MNSIYCGEDMSIVDDRRDSFDQNTIVHLYCIIILVHSIDRKNVLKQNVLPNRHFIKIFTASNVQYTRYFSVCSLKFRKFLLERSFDEWNGHLHYVFKTI